MAGMPVGIPKQNSITQRAAQGVEDGRAQQESLDAFGLLSQHFFDQVVQHEMVAAGEGLNETGRVRVLAWRARPAAGRQSSLRCGFPM